MPSFIPSLKRVFGAIASAVCGVAVIGFAIGTVETPPPYALVLVNAGAGEYAPPPFIDENPSLRSLFTSVTTYAQAREVGYKLQQDCVRQRCWAHDGRSLTGSALEKIGILPHSPKRWNDDGTWNW